MKSLRPARRAAAAATASTLSVAGLLLAAAPGPAASAASLAEALDAAPADADLVLAFPSLQGFSSMVARLAATAGVDDDGTDDLLGSFKRELGLGAGLDDGGAGLVVLRNVGEAVRGAGGDPPSAFLVLPVTDYDAFVGGLEKPEAPADGVAAPPAGVTAVRLGGEDSMVRRVGSFAVLAEGLEEIAAYEAGGAAAAALAAMGGYAVDAADGPDAALYLSVSSMREDLQALADDLVGEAAGANGGGPPLGEAFAPLLAEAVRGLTDSVDGVLVTARMTPDRVALDVAARAKPGSPVASFLTDRRGDPLALLAKLPADPFLTAQATDLAAVDVPALTAAFSAAATRGAENLRAGGGDADAALADAIVRVVEAWSATSAPAADATAYATVNYASNPQAMMTGGVFQTLTATAAADPGAIQKALPGKIQAMQDRLGPAVRDLIATLQRPADADLDAAIDEAPADGAPADAAAAVAVTGSHNPNALTLAGTSVDQYQVSFALPPEAVANLGPAGIVLGNAGVSGFAAATDGVYLQTASAEPAFMERALLAGQGGGGVPTLAEDASLAGVPEALPEGLVSVGYLSLGGIAETVNPFLVFVAPDAPPLQVPAGLAPLSAGVALAGGGGDAAGARDLGLRVNVPVALIEFVRDTYAEMAPALGGGADAGRGPGAGPPPAPF